MCGVRGWVCGGGGSRSSVDRQCRSLDVRGTDRISRRASGARTPVATRRARRATAGHPARPRRTRHGRAQELRQGARCDRAGGIATSHGLSARRAQQSLPVWFWEEVQALLHRRPGLIRSRGVTSRQRVVQCREVARPRGRRASRQDHLPSVPRARRLRDDARQLGRVDALGGDADVGTVLGRKREAIVGALRASDDASVCLARVREGLAVAELDVEEPLLPSRGSKPERRYVGGAQSTRGNQFSRTAAERQQRWSVGTSLQHKRHGSSSRVSNDDEHRPACRRMIRE